MRPRATRRSVLAAAVALLAGCGGERTPPEETPVDATPTDSPPAETPTDSPTVTPDRTPTGTANTDCPPTLTVYEAREEPVDEASAVDYDDLTESQKRTFERARNRSVEEFDDAWYDIQAVSYRGTYYRASVAVC